MLYFNLINPITSAYIASNVFLMFLSSYSLEVKKLFHADTASFKEIRINPRTALTEEVSGADVFKSIAYLPLQTTKQSQFGDIDQLELTSDYFFILEHNHSQVNARINSAIIIFKRSGEFHAKINTVECFFFSLELVHLTGGIFCQI